MLGANWTAESRHRRRREAAQRTIRVSSRNGRDRTTSWDCDLSHNRTQSQLGGEELSGVIPSERSQSAILPWVIPSERSESRDLHFLPSTTKRAAPLGATRLVQTRRGRNVRVDRPTPYEFAASRTRSTRRFFAGTL